MIAFLKGEFAYKSPALVHVDVDGVGYEVQISLNTYSQIQSPEKGHIAYLFQMQEDAHPLWIF